MNKAQPSKNPKIAVIGLGYMGLPLARLFAAKYPVIGFDINQKRVEDYRTEAHHEFLNLDLEQLKTDKAVVYDAKERLEKANKYL